MPAASVLIIGSGDEALEETLAELGVRVERSGSPGEARAAGIVTPDLVLAPFDGPEGSSPHDVRRDFPGSDLVLLVAAAQKDAGMAAARTLEAELITLPADRRAVETLRQALEHHARAVRDRALVARVRALDPELAGEIETLARDRETKARALDEAARLRSSFIANISHEIRTPITVMQGMLEILADDLAGNLSDDHRDLLQRVRISGESLLDLVQGVLDLAKAEAGVLEVRPSRIYFPDFVADLVANVEPLLSRKPVRLLQSVAREIEWLTVDATHLRQLLAQLLSNALKFTAEGEIRLEARLTGSGGPPPDDPATLLRAPVAGGDTLEVVVTDTGRGIPPADQELIFEAFRQVDLSATREHEGIGIGLAVVRQMARLLDASLQLESQPGAGTRFRVRLPVTAVQGPAPAHGALAGTPARSARSRIRDSRGVLPELASLALTSPATPGDAAAFVLDLVDRLLHPESVILAERGDRGWRITDVVGQVDPSVTPGSATPLAATTLERLAAERRAVREKSAVEGASTWIAAPVLGEGERTVGLLAARGRSQGNTADEDLKILLVAARWLGLECERQRLARERGEIVATVGRDLKNPLGSLLAYTQTLLRGLCGPLAPEQRRVVLRVERAIHRAILSALDLLDYQRAVARGLTVERAAFSLERVIEHVLGRHGAAIEVGGHRVARDVAPDLPACRGDEIRTDRAISNVVRALLERSPDESELRVSASTAAGSVRCELAAPVRDLAPFLAALGGEAAPLAINETLGLGLSRRWIEAQGGRIDLQIRPEEVRVSVSLPAAVE